MPEKVNPLVSAIIPNYNYSQYVGEAVESALGQTYPNIEVIVVDDGSSDDSLRVLERYGDRIKIVTQSNAGVSAARNRGVADSSGELIAFLDADDVWLPKKIEKQVVAFRAADVGIVHVGVVDIDAGGTPMSRHLHGAEGFVADRLILWEGPVILGGGSGVMMTRDDFQKVGGFDTDLLTSADWDLYYRIARDAQVVFIKEPLLHYRLHGSNMHSNVRRMEREMGLYYEKVFAEGGEVLRLKARAMGNYHRVLAGSYFRSGSYGDFLRHAAKSVWHRPSGIGYFAAFPLRRFRG